ncbi:MAG: alcohol dehydrogenase catalytic domain-containing protein [Nitrososphaeraceae archaeon]
MHASGLCYTDVHITEGLVPTGAFPRTIGHEPAGDIVEVGEGVTSRKIGDREEYHFFKRHAEGANGVCAGSRCSVHK